MHFDHFFETIPACDPYSFFSQPPQPFLNPPRKPTSPAAQKVSEESALCRRRSHGPPALTALTFELPTAASGFPIRFQVPSRWTFVASSPSPPMKLSSCLPALATSP